MIRALPHLALAAMLAAFVYLVLAPTLAAVSDRLSAATLTTRGGEATSMSTKGN